MSALAGRGFVLALLAVLSMPLAWAQDSRLTYQGHLQHDGVSANGTFDLLFLLQDTAGATIGSPIARDDTLVADGVFTVTLDFGTSAFDGSARFLLIQVREGDSVDAHTALLPRSPVTPVPYAQLADSAAFAATVADDSIDSLNISDGSIGAADIDSSSVQLRVNGTCPAGQAIQSVAANGSVSCESGLQGETGPQGPQGTPGSADAWSRSGNANTDPSVNYVGTSDTATLVLGVSSAPALRIDAINMNGANVVTLVGGSRANSAEAGARGVTIAGGGQPTAGDEQAPGGSPNIAFDHYAAIGGGAGNHAGSEDPPGPTDATFATVAGGLANQAVARQASVGGGHLNLAGGQYAAVAGGANNAALRTGGAVVGGSWNTAYGLWATVSGGFNNCSGGSYSWAGGRRAKVRLASTAGIDPRQGCDGVASSGDGDGDEGSFVWSDTQEADFVSNGSDQFNIRAQGGVRLHASTDMHFGSTGRQMLNLYSDTYGIGVQTSTFYQRSNSRFAWFRGGSHIDEVTDPGAGGDLLMTLHGSGATTVGTPTGTARAQTFTNVSDRNAKLGFAMLDVGGILAKVLAMPITRWSYRNTPEESHIGPMAQDFRAAFGLGENDTTIATIDADGIALAAIQGLNAKLERENAAMATRLAALEVTVAELSAGQDALGKNDAD